jgi:hypothetical protein
VETIEIELWLYGPMARYAGDQSNGSYAQLHIRLPAGSTMCDLLERLELPSTARGITFVNGDLASLPGLDTDLCLELHDGDRVGISHPKSMWPYQYRFGAATTTEMQETFRERSDGGVRHAYTQLREKSS